MHDNLVLGLDIGGANTKAALLQYDKGTIIQSWSYIKYFPFWEKKTDDIVRMLERLVEKISNISKVENLMENITSIAITITAELSDAFQTKKEGILTILKALEQVFPPEKLNFISNTTQFVGLKKARKKCTKIAAANWVSTALYLGHFLSDCILIDAGSTTIDIIPLRDGKPVAKGYNDITRMMHHELIYTGGLRATIPSITHFVPYKEKQVRISFEKFSLISDVHRILNNISEKEYINDTADNRGKSLKECYARLARILCMDLNMISKKELDKIADYIYEKQKTIIKTEMELFFKQLTSRISLFSKDSPFVITGLAAKFLIRPCLEELGFTDIRSYEKIVNIPDHISSSAFGVAGALIEILNKT
ncbi:MAG: hydantoinase/oxoprolinase family protein [Promethearchaeia archaeon]